MYSLSQKSVKSFKLRTQDQNTLLFRYNPLNIRQRVSRLDIRKQFYSQRVVNGWNKVPTDIKNSVAVNSFKMA